MVGMESVRIEYLGNSIEMPFGETVVGRDVSCTLRFNDPSVSRKHLRFIRREEEVFVEDLGSSNGTLLNGRKLGGALQLIDGDKVKFGSRELLIHVTDSDLDDRSTLLLRNVKSVDELPNKLMLRNFGSQEVKGPRSRTAPIAIVSPLQVPAAQRCPKCAAPVSEVDDECPSCHYNWGSFRAMTNTDVRPMSIARRRHDRQPVALRLIYVSSELEVEAVTKDLSESGVFVCTQVLDPIGTKCSLTILVDGGPPLAITGIVRRVVEHSDDRSQETGLGVQFLEIGDGELEWIRAVIRQSSAPAA
jgi:hypothetical protein